MPATLRLEFARAQKQPAQFGQLEVGFLEEVLHENREI
jgi:hypothetical protein